MNRNMKYRPWNKLGFFENFEILKIYSYSDRIIGDMTVAWFMKELEI